jgi:hypothetical protein
VIALRCLGGGGIGLIGGLVEGCTAFVVCVGAVY